MIIGRLLGSMLIELGRDDNRAAVRVLVRVWNGIVGEGG